MALFKSRKAAEEPVAAAAQTESVDAMRRRAKHRLIGAFVLVLLGVVGFPLLFDTQPRPIPVDIPIEIPDRNKTKPFSQPAMPAAPVAAASTTTPAPQPKAVASGVVTPETVEAKPVAIAKAEVKASEPRPESKPEARAEAKPAASPATDDGARAKALLEGKPLDLTEGRFIVQIGAFADPEKARETRLKVERAGMKTYTHVADTKDGKLTRVRVGPFTSRADADKAAEKLKGLDLQPKVLTL